MTCAEDITRLAGRALAATATAYLSGDGGTRYGAAVLTASGRIFEAGQYSFFNHQTGVHSEQAALVAAVASGCPDILALAVASTKARDFTRPCGTCRQIILEHAARCGRSIDFVMVGPGGSCDVRPIEALLPESWLPAAPTRRVSGRRRGGFLTGLRGRFGDVVGPAAARPAWGGKGGDGFSGLIRAHRPPGRFPQAR